ncbi:hypothetical protein [Domibacillus robiginosus]|uniref:hypothetical protein n=1 Tax=Domibacillus robiginosus TaxID=1071054 RepID=UPI00067BABF7|nr:hypothetical protein [Domibacillus robiginosus]
MDYSVSKNVSIVSYILAFTLIFTMVATSVMLKDPEVIFPEIAAMAIAMWVYREPGWIRQPSKIVFAPTVTAAIGFLTNQLPIDYLGKAILTLVLMMLFLRSIQSNLAASLATGLLPIVINADHWSFIISVFAFSFIIMLGVLVFKLNKGLEKKVKIQYKYMLVFLVIHFIWIGLCWLFGYPQLAVIPPIVVVVYESLQKSMYNEKMALKQVIVLTISATVGTLLYFAIDSWVLVLLLDMILMLLLVRISGMRIPAVYAYPLLPFVFPAHVIPMLPIASLVATVFFFGSVLAYKKFEMKQKAKEGNAGIM